MRDETRIDVGPVPPAARAPRDAPRSWAMPLHWVRRKKGVVLLLLALLAFIYVFMTDRLDTTRLGLRLSGASPLPRVGDPDILKLLSEVPGSVPGVHDSGNANSVANALARPKGRGGEPYPSREELTLLLLQQLRSPDYRVDNEQWKAWTRWLESGHSDAAPHVEFLMQLKRAPGGSMRDVHMFLDDPLGWKIKHRFQTRITVFSKTYCPYSRAAKSLLDSLGAHYQRYEIDQRPDGAQLQDVLKHLLNHSTVPMVVGGSQLLGGSDRLHDLHEHGLLEGILRGSGAFD